ncbi:hypothetical protein [Solitalea koreensis]|uniref:Uncharacterized protein n=1 Tax=Solitalea koreensis TaxID=543615 RepID=A0A521CXS3_9SPHI|nr:hypothetical protein [Solitalea koreensis]SMO64247.1 hypothetical protein SAMN06265350_10519 [Solitalea koreensis]
MTKENIIEKIGSVLMELRNEYVTINQLQDKVSEIDLELFAANAVYLNQHVDILKKLINQETIVIEKVKEAEELALKDTTSSLVDTVQNKIEPESFVATQTSEIDNSKVNLESKVLSTPQIINIETVRAEINSRYQDEKNSVNDSLAQLKIGKQHVNESVQKQVKDIRAGIGLNEKFTFIKTLFNNDQKAYDQSLDQINTLSTINEARTFIKNELMTAYEWNNKQEIAEKFLTILNKRFTG